MRIARKIENITCQDKVVRVKTDSVEIRIMLLTDDILRIRAGFDGDFAEESYDLTLTAWEDRMDDYMKDYRKRTELKNISCDLESEGHTIVKGGDFKLDIQHSPFMMTIYDKDGYVIHEDIPQMGWMCDSNNRRIHTSVIEEGDHFYGFGERTGRLDKKDKLMRLAPGDCMGYNPKETDPLYKHIPFYIKLNDKTRRAVGYFYHNTWESDFNMGRSHSNYVKHHSSYKADGGDIDLFLIAGPKVRTIIERYTDLTGKSVMLPKAALGYLGSSMYYPELPVDADEGILEFIDTAKSEDIPIDGFQLSSGYCNIETEHGLKRCTFTWNKDRFKDPADFFERMTDKGITVSSNVKPGMLLEHPMFKEMEDKDFFVKDSKEDETAIGLWWGGDGAYVDYTSDKNRTTWKEYLKKNLLDYGTTSVWNDNCEYDGLTDKDARVSFEGKGATIGQIKSEMANIMCHIAREAVDEAHPGARPFVVCRSGHSGIQRYAQVWAGDNFTSWDTLKYNIATILGMSLSGVANQGCDIGGFYGPAPEEELFVRWVQNGIFQPRFSIHSTNTDNTVTEPWMYYGTKNLISDAIKFRYALSPYLYSLMRRAAVKGLPIMEPLLSAFQDDEKTYSEDINFMEGDSLLVANVVDKGAADKKIYFPKGYNFYDFYNRKEYEGGSEATVPVELSSIPLFVKEGGIVPIAENALSNLTNDKVTTLKLLCAPSSKAGDVTSFELYDDDGQSLDYKDGKYLLTTITMTSGERVTLDFKTEGSYGSSVKNMHIDMIHRQSSPFWVQIDGKLIPHFLHKAKYDECNEGWYYDQTLKSVQIKYPKTKEDYSVVVSFENNDLLGM
ncbi:TIM-barrel domain-containing protein [Butyrivibrio fibrisolvens]|uniref:Alpha-glucosidase n=1 Tax=Butyrivibrio fibrisolvens TaxID=831 RepID=A0A317G0J6_BUTFI|nr:TIM-barrel domain-containing protein [Butyrivibrio fibrisolvens]PWT26866.1 alpha-glucosidase [Butyrivibrio fibrisolvens]